MLIRTQFPDLGLASMLPALDEVIFNRFDKFPAQYTNIFRTLTSSRSIEQTSEIAGLGLFTEVKEGKNLRYDEAIPGFNMTYLHLQYALGFKISRVMVDDDRFGIITKLASDLGRSAKETREITAASVFNNGFTTLGPDGKALFATDHPMVKTGGVQTNTLAIPADLDIASLEIALTDFRRMKDPSGKKIRVRPETLIVPPELEFVASEIINGTMRSDTANHTINAFKNRVGTPSFEKLVIWDYLSDVDAWFIETSPEETELRWYDREKFSTVHDVEFDSRSIKTAGWQRFSVGFSSFYGVYGSPGA